MMVDKRSRKITIMAVGDAADFDSYVKFNQERDLLRNSGFDYVAISYKQLLQKKLPKIDNKKVVVFLFFPFSYWDKYIEKKHYKGIYGNLSFANRFSHFWQRVNAILQKRMADKEVLFINSPLANGLYRDKLAVKKGLSCAKILQPALHKKADIKNIKNLLQKNCSFFLKPRCGSQGKGLTFLSRSSWKTNFIFKHNKIINRQSDYGWRFKDVTGNEDFLRQLLKKDILIEETVQPLILKHSMLDLRVYVLFNKAIYVYPRRNFPDRLVTNISQGAWGDPSALAMLPKSLIESVKKTAQRVSKILGLSFCGIDIMPSEKRKDIYVIDVNLFPGFPSKKKFNLAKRIIEELSKSRNRGSLSFEKAGHI